MRCYRMRRMIDPSRFAEDVASHATPSNRIQQKTDAEAVEDWEDEGGASSHSGGIVVANDLENEVKEEAKCT